MLNKSLFEISIDKYEYEVPSAVFPRLDKPETIVSGSIGLLLSSRSFFFSTLRDCSVVERESNFSR